MLNPSCTAPCPNRPSTSFGDARFEVYTGVTGSAGSRPEALSRMNFPLWVLRFSKSVLHQEMQMQRATKTLSSCLTAPVFGSRIAGDQFLMFTVTLLTLVSNGRNSPCAGGNAVFCTGYHC